MSKNVIIGQSGGPTAVINSSLAGVYKAACSLGADKVYGMKYGIEGLLKEEMLELNVLLDDRMSIELLKRTPSSYLGSCRYKLPDPDVDSTPLRCPGGQQRPVHRCAQDHRQRPLPDRPHSWLRLCRQVHCHHPEGGHP